MTTPCVLLIDPPQHGARNMAVDEALLAARAAACDSLPVLRFYQWSPTTLSLGYFQSIAQREEHAPSRSCEIVRRATGGGAILHDHDWTYSFVLPASHELATKPLEIYTKVHLALVEVLAELGVDCRLAGGSATADRIEPNAPEPFLCFLRRSEMDVVVPVSERSDIKILGSAQRRREGAILQHGSLLLKRSQAAPELAGLRDVAKLSVSDEELMQNWQRAIAQRLNINYQPGELTPIELQHAEEIEATRYANKAWTRKR